MNLQEYQKMIERVGSRLWPDEDWMPVLFLEKEGHAAVVGIPMMGDSQESKDITATMITVAIAICNPDSIAWLVTAWTIPQHVQDQWKGHGEKYLEAYEKGYVPRASEHPERVEIVSVIIMGKKIKDALMIGYIQRFTDKPPKITKWDVHENEGDEHQVIMKGRFPEAIQLGFEKADPEGNLGRLNKLSEEMQT